MLDLGMRGGDAIAVVAVFSLLGTFDAAGQWTTCVATTIPTSSTSSSTASSSFGLRGCDTCQQTSASSGCNDCGRDCGAGFVLGQGPPTHWPCARVPTRHADSPQGRSLHQEAGHRCHDSVATAIDKQTYRGRYRLAPFPSCDNICDEAQTWGDAGQLATPASFGANATMSAHASAGKMDGGSVTQWAKGLCTMAMGLFTMVLLLWRCWQMASRTRRSPLARRARAARPSWHSCWGLLIVCAAGWLPMLAASPASHGRSVSTVSSPSIVGFVSSWSQLDGVREAGRGPGVGRSTCTRAYAHMHMHMHMHWACTARRRKCSRPGLGVVRGASASPHERCACTRALAPRPSTHGWARAPSRRL